jgi:hypothetical protein
LGGLQNLPLARIVIFLKTLPTSFRIASFWDFIARNSKYSRTQRFGNWICLHPQVKGRHLLSWVPQRELDSMNGPHLMMEQTQFSKCYVFWFLSGINHRQNTAEPTLSYSAGGRESPRMCAPGEVRVSTVAILSVGAYRLQRSGKWTARFCFAG